MEITFKKASLTDIHTDPSRNITINLHNSLCNCNWIPEVRNLIITGPTGSGKTWIACADGNHAIVNGHTLYFTGNMIRDMFKQAEARNKILAEKIL